jgi:hypothetical protein
MSVRLILSCLGLIAMCSGVVGADAGNLVANPGFETVAGQTLPGGWSVWSPQWGPAACRAQGTAGGLSIESGGEYPVFDTDFGRVGMQICYDWFFPESTAILARKGAEVILAPTWGDTLPDSDGKVNGETTFRVRARDNGVYLVPSVYDGNSLVIDPMGRVLASSAGKTGVFWAEVDLDKREPLDWVGYWRSIGPRDRMPGTYHDL